MPISVKFATGSAGHALKDLADALAETVKAGDNESGDWLIELLHRHFRERLAGKSPAQLVAHLASLQVWRSDPGPVFKTADLPCAAYAAIEWGGELTILVLGFCYRYPISEQMWWTEVIRPRLRIHL